MRIGAEPPEPRLEEEKRTAWEEIGRYELNITVIPPRSLGGISYVFVRKGENMGWRKGEKKGLSQTILQ